MGEKSCDDRALCSRNARPGKALVERAQAIPIIAALPQVLVFFPHRLVEEQRETS